MDNKLLETITFLAKQAGQATLPYYHENKDLKIDMKDEDGRQSPVTAADHKANDIIVSGLELAADYPVLSEEGKHIPYSTRQKWQRYWLVDPLDGTKGFIKQMPEYTVNIALIENHQPIMGAVYIPVTDELYFARQGHGAFKQVGDAEPEQIQTRTKPASPMDVLVGHFDHSKNLSSLLALLQEHTDYHLIRLNSSMKFCRVAEGEGDAYARLGPTSEWDTAAGQAILEAAGGQVVDTDGLPLRYNTEESILNPHFCAVSQRDIIPPLLADIRHIKSLREKLTS